MDTKDINISKSEEEALKIMEDISSVTSGQIQSLKEDYYWCDKIALVLNIIK